MATRNSSARLIEGLRKLIWRFNQKTFDKSFSLLCRTPFWVVILGITCFGALIKDKSLAILIVYLFARFSVDHSKNHFTRTENVVWRVTAYVLLAIAVGAGAYFYFNNPFTLVAISIAMFPLAILDSISD